MPPDRFPSAGPPNRTRPLAQHGISAPATGCQRINDSGRYALLAAIAYVRAAVDRANVPMREACQQLAEYPVYPVP